VLASALRSTVLALAVPPWPRANKAAAPSSSAFFHAWIEFLVNERHGWFTEGFDTPVLQDAKALLDELM
jgi:hypothetical protein